VTGRNEVRDAAAAASFPAAAVVASLAPSLLASGVPAVVGAPLSVAQRDRRAMIDVSAAIEAWRTRGFVKLGRVVDDAMLARLRTRAVELMLGAPR
jgi:hypothetical protein